MYVLCSLTVFTGKMFSVSLTLLCDGLTGKRGWSYMKGKNSGKNCTKKYLAGEKMLNPR